LKINSAVADMQSGMSARSAALKWGVPQTTLQYRKKAGFKSVARPGPATVLTTDEETALCNWLIELSRRGIPVQKKHFLDSIQIITTDGRQTPFVKTELLACTLVLSIVCQRLNGTCAKIVRNGHAEHVHI